MRAPTRASLPPLRLLCQHGVWVRYGAACELQAARAHASYFGSSNSCCTLT